MAARNALTILAIAACSANNAPPAGPSAPGPGSGAPAGGSAIAVGSGSSATPVPMPSVKVTLADVGLEASSLDRTADPCVDFYQFACGGWLAATQIPAERARWARFSEIDDKNRGALKQLLEDATKGSSDPAVTKLGDYYASCMDEETLEKTGLGAVKPVLDRVAKIKDARSWQAALIDLHKLGDWVVFQPMVGPDYKRSTMNVVTLRPEGLGLPDRDYYLRPEHADKLAAYRVHVGKLLALAGIPLAKVEAAANNVVVIETELAKLRKTAVEERDLQGGYNPIDTKTLAKQVKLDWKLYWKAFGAKPGNKLVITTPRYFRELDRLRQRIKPAQWASYFTYHLVSRRTLALPKVFDDQAFELERLLTGVEQKLDRARRCVDATEHALGELLGLQYVSKYFPSSSKQAATTMFDAMVKVMNEQLGKLDWMSEPTRKLSQQKLARVGPMIGFPEQPKVYAFDVKRPDFVGNTLRAQAYETRRQLQKAGKPVDRNEWQMQAFTVDAYYEPTMNITALPAGILQPPLFGPDRSVAANLGGIGMVIGHELTHAFDDQGAQFDAEGNLSNWWQKDDEAQFKERGTCVADQYSTFEVLKGQFINGRLTLGEDIADMGGVKLAFTTYRALRKDAPKVYNADGFTEDQQFFLAVGQAWCSKARPAEVQYRLTTDPHSPPKFRIYGALRNLPAFAEAFSCAAGTPMRPANACSVW
ncbi:MAG: M13 family metallopeptidase [Kofleriaceae bacterium]